MTRGQHVPFVPRAVLQLRDSAAGLAPGYYVFIEERKAEMVLARVEEDEDGDLVATGVRHRAHVNSKQAFAACGLTACSRRHVG
jgi:hypothetical protein